jgi:citronellol/citronellal dehydrogenase
LPAPSSRREEESVASAFERAAAHFGGVDILVNNASAISLTGTADTEMRRFDLMHAVNTRGTFLCTKLALPYLRRAANPHVLNLAPPLDLKAQWFAPHLAYTLAKFGMSLCTLGHAEEFRSLGIAVNALWPLTTIDTAAVRNIVDPLAAGASRTVEIMSDAAYRILTCRSREMTGRFLIDEEVLRGAGVSDFARYDAGPGGPRSVDLFVPDEVLQRLPTRLRGFGS